MRTWKTISALSGIALLCATVTHAQSTSRGFSVVLLLGETQGTPGGDDTDRSAFTRYKGLPPAPALSKALSDVRDFLPYKSYKLLDTQWLRGGSTRMKGLDDQEYDVDLVADSIPPVPVCTKDCVLNVLFHLQEVGAPANSSEEYGRSIQAADLERRRAEEQRALAELPANSPSSKARMAGEIAQMDKQIRLARARKLIDSRFQMALGETVVVGTSKIGGDKGLVVLLTSVAGGK